MCPLSPLCNCSRSNGEFRRFLITIPDFTPLINDYNWDESELNHAQIFN